MSGTDLDRAQIALDTLRATLGAIEDSVSDAGAELERLRERFEPALRLVPPPARSFEVTGDDAELFRAAMRRETGVDLGDDARIVLVDVYAQLARRTDAGGPEVTENDLRESNQVIREATGRNAVAAVLEHDRARVAARMAGGAL